MQSRSLSINFYRLMFFYFSWGMCSFALAYHPLSYVIHCSDPQTGQVYHLDCRLGTLEVLHYYKRKTTLVKRAEGMECLRTEEKIEGFKNLQIFRVMDSNHELAFVFGYDPNSPINLVHGFDREHIGNSKKSMRCFFDYYY